MKESTFLIFEIKFASLVNYNPLQIASMYSKKFYSIGVKTVKIIEFRLIWGSPLVNSRYIGFFIGVTYT